MHTITILFLEDGAFVFRDGTLRYSKEITMETIDYHAQKENFIALALLHLMGDKYTEIMPEGNKGIFEVEVKLNGVEVSFSHLCKLIEDQYDKAVAVARS